MPEKETKLSQTENDAIYKEAIDRFEEVSEREKDQRQKAIDDMKFTHAEDGQWDETATKRREGRPRYTINRVAGAIDQVTGDQRQNPTQIKVRPLTDGSEDVAKVEMGLIRNIEYQSKAQSIYSYSFGEMATGGYGGWRVLTEFSDDDSFEQDILIEVIKSAASSLYLDPNARKFDKRDAMYGFVIKELTEAKFKEQYPNATVTDFSQDLYTTGLCSSWFTNNMVRVAEYWKVTEVPTKLAFLSDGRTIDLIEEEAVIDELADKGITVLKTRPSTKRKVESFIMNGAEVLKGPMPWAGKYIPLILIQGRSYNIEGKDYVRGITRFAKDANRIANYSTSNTIEATAMTPKDPYWITSVQAKGHTAALKSFNTTNSPFMQYNTDPQAPGPPQRTGAPSVQTALIQQTIQAIEDVHATTGLHPASMGNAAQLLSEKSVIAQADKGDRGVFVFSANLSEGINYTGDILVDLMPRIYDTERVVRVLDFDGTTKDVGINVKGLNEFNQPIIDEETGEEVIVNDLSRGKYETFVETGPAFMTMRKESTQQLIDLTAASDVFAQLTPDLIAKGIGGIESEELTKRVRKWMIKQGLVEPTEEETKEMGLDQEQQPSEADTALLENIKMQTAELMAKIQKLNAEADNTDAKTTQANVNSQSQLVGAYETLLKSYQLQQDIGIPLGIDEHQVRDAQQALVSLGQDELIRKSVESS